MSFHHSAVISKYNPSYAVPQESGDINAYDMFPSRSYTENEIMNFDLDLPEHRLLLASSMVDVSDLLVGIEQSLAPTVFSSPTDIGDKGQHQRSARELQARQQQAPLRCPSPSINSLDHAYDLQIIDCPVFDPYHHEHQSSAHRPALSPPSLPATTQRDSPSRSQSIHPAPWAMSEPAPTSSPSRYRLTRTARNYHCQAESCSDLQYGEPATNYTIISHRTPIARSYPSFENSLVELTKHRDEEYGRSQPGRGIPNLSQVTNPPSQTRAPNEFALEEPRPQPPGKNFKWRVFKSHRSAKSRPPSTPSLSTTSTTMSTSQGSGSTSEAQSSPPTSPKPPTPSHPANSPSPASAPSSSSSSHQSTKRKRDNDERSPSSSTPAKKSKRACKGNSQGPPRKQGKGPM